MYSVGIITSSDKGYKGEREDKSGEIIKKILKENGFEIKKDIVLPDDKEMLANEFIYMSGDLKLNFILSTGGTGFWKLDISREST